MSGSNDYNERRGSGRANTRRRAVLRRRGAPHTAHEAMVVDVAPLGLRIVCQVNLQPGDELDVEVHRQHGEGQPLEVRGVVRHVGKADEQHSVGVQLIVTLGATADAGAVPPAKEIRDQLAALRAQLANMNESDTRSINFDVFGATDQEASTTQQPNMSRPRLLLLLTCVAVLGLFLMTWSCQSRHYKRNADTAWNERAWWSALLGGEEDADPGGEASEREEEPVVYTLAQNAEEQGWEALRASAAKGALPPLPLPEGKVEDYPGVLLMARLRVAEGDRTSALRLLGVLGDMERNDNAPQSWIQHGQQLRETLLSNERKPEELPVPLPALSLPLPSEETLGEEVAQETANVETPPGVLRIEVDTSSYTLYAKRDGALLAAYPVGLGAGSKTPRGTFYINNKIENPDWYDRGRVVPHGHPENILGNHWLGLAGAPEALGIGIHPTEEHETIGGNAGRGCIRMFPLDAQQLFAWCEVGVEVVIR